LSHSSKLMWSVSSTNIRVVIPPKRDYFSGGETLDTCDQAS
jgi:hypothetical protein